MTEHSKAAYRRAICEMRALVTPAANAIVVSGWPAARAAVTASSHSASASFRRAVARVTRASALAVTSRRPSHMEHLAYGPTCHGQVLRMPQRLCPDDPQSVWATGEGGPQCDLVSRTHLPDRSLDTADGVSGDRMLSSAFAFARSHLAYDAGNRGEVFRNLTRHGDGDSEVSARPAPHTFDAGASPRILDLLPWRTLAENANGRARERKRDNCVGHPVGPPSHRLNTLYHTCQVGLTDEADESELTDAELAEAMDELAALVESGEYAEADDD